MKISAVSTLLQSHITWWTDRVRRQAQTCVHAPRRSTNAHHIDIGGDEGLVEGGRQVFGVQAGLDALLGRLH